MLNLNFHAKLKIKKSAFGNRLLDYEIQEPLGKGGFSDVHKAICYRTNTYVAVKMIKKDVIRKEGLFERISQEINIQSELDHPSVLKLLTAFDDTDFVYIVLELCSKGELMKYVNKDGKRTLSEREARTVMLQIIDGLEYLHSKNIFHRDIKLANILLTEHMQIKIADFGLATRILYPGECHTTMCGTPNYISPEIVSHKTQGPEVDLWSLGCLFYTLLVGRPPFETDTVKNTLNRVVAGNYWMPINLSLSAQDLIRKLLQKNPHHRLNLKEIRNHSFMLDDCTMNNSKWISNDSGLGTNTVSLDYVSSRFHSLDRKHLSGNSNGYYSFETPKSSRRSKSQDTKKSKDRFDIYQKDPISSVKEMELEFSPVDYERMENSRGYRRINTYQLKTAYAKNSTNKEFSPTQRCASHHERQNCEMFCEDEVLNSKSSGHSKRDCIQSCEYLQSSPVFAKLNEKKVLRCGISEDLPCRKLHYFAEEKARNIKTAMREFISGEVSSESDYIEDRVKVVPFNTERLKTTRHRLKNAIFSILENGDVCVELLRNKSKLKEMVVEVVRISKNGLKMYVYYPNKGRGVFPVNSPPPLPLHGADAVFNCETLSKENWKKYSYAARFVEMVQSKTPKLTLYTNKARCVLMENKPEPDFEIIYYDGAKITKSRKGIKLTDNNGVISVLDDTGQEYLEDSKLTEHYEYFIQCYDYCRLIERQLASTCSSDSETIFKVFPAILGKKPDSRDEELDWNCVNSPNIFHSTKYPT